MSEAAGGPVVTAFGETVRLEVEGGVATLRLDRPKMNAIDLATQEGIRQAAVAAAEDRSIAAVVVYGGERVFAAGADVKEMSTMSHADMVVRGTLLQASIATVAAIPKPVVAAVTGYALGGGCELAMGADLRFVAEDAKMGQPEILLGIIPGMGGSQRLTRLVGSPGPRTSSSPGGRSPPTRRWRSGWPTGCSPATRCTPRPSPGRGSSSAVPRSRWPLPSPPSTPGWTVPWRPAWRSSGTTSRRCSRPRTAPAG